MYILSRLDSNPKQTIYYNTEDKQQIKFHFYFLPTQSNWFVDIECGNFQLYGTRLCNHPNLLTKYHNIINWGLNVQTVDGYDPYQVTDFSDGKCIVSVLTSSEVAEVESYLNGENQ